MTEEGAVLVDSSGAYRLPLSIKLRDLYSLPKPG